MMKFDQGHQNSHVHVSLNGKRLFFFLYIFFYSSIKTYQGTNLFQICIYLFIYFAFPNYIIIINPLTARVVGAPHMIFLQPVFYFFSLFFTALWDLPNSRPVHTLMLSSHLFLCPPCLLPPFTVPCKMVLARSDERET